MPDAGTGGWVKIFDVNYNGNGVLTIPVAPGGFTMRILFTGTVIPFSGVSEWYARTSAGGTTNYTSFISGEGSVTQTPVGPVQPGMLMARTADQTYGAAVSFDYQLNELPPRDGGIVGGGLVGFGSGVTQTASGPMAIHAGGSAQYTGTSTSVTVQFWNTSNVTGRFVALQLM